MNKGELSKNNQASGEARRLFAAKYNLPDDHPALDAILQLTDAHDIAVADFNRLLQMYDDLRREYAESIIDPVTGLMTRGPWEKIITPRIEAIQQGSQAESSQPNAAALIIADAEDLHFINNRLGYVIGDQSVFNGGEALRAMADYMQSVTRNSDRRASPRGDESGREADSLVRLGGDEFGGFFPVHIENEDDLREATKLIAGRIKDGFKVSDDTLMPRIYWGCTFIQKGEDKSLKDYLNEADPKLHLSPTEKVKRSVRKIGRRAVGNYSISFI